MLSLSSIPLRYKGNRLVIAHTSLYNGGAIYGPWGQLWPQAQGQGFPKADL
jgi:hypothetical protein